MVSYVSPFFDDTRGASETLGYVLLLAVVLFSIGSVATMGVPVIEDQQDEEYISNTVRAFEVFGNNLDAIERDRAPARETEIRYQGGTLFQNEDLFMEVNVTHDGESRTHVIAGTPVTYVHGDSSVHYEAGAVIRDGDHQGLMRTEPPFSFTEDRIRMSVVTTTVQDDPQSLSGSGKIAITARQSGATTHEFIRGDDPDDVEVEISLTSPRYEVWDQYFQEQGLDRQEIDHDTNTIRYTASTQDLMIRETLVQIDARN